KAKSIRWIAFRRGGHESYARMAGDRRSRWVGVAPRSNPCETTGQKHPERPMYVLHIANKNYSSWSLRPWVLLTQLGIPFEERLHIFPSDGPSYPEFSKFSPTGFVPVLD